MDKLCALSRAQHTLYSLGVALNYGVARTLQRLLSSAAALAASGERCELVPAGCEQLGCSML